jgi:hypothetical protein
MAHVKTPWNTWLRMALITAVASTCFPAAHAQTADALHQRYTSLQSRLADNAFKRPLYLESTQTSGTLKGDIHAVVQQPYSLVSQALSSADNWCDVLMLHLNVKHCQASKGDTPQHVKVSIGKKFDQPLDDAYKVDFNYRVAAKTDDFLQVQLNATDGPLGTHDYRIVLEAIPLDAQRSFIHMSYAYAYGMAARVAMQGYLATVGSHKVGFSVVGNDKAGKPVHVGNVRGVIERNTMRYYLAIEAFLGAYQTPSAGQPEKRLRDWFAATERYPQQLHELDQDTYLQMKRKELQRRGKS